MKLPPELEFHEDLHLLIYRPHGVIDEAAVKKLVSVLEDLEARLEKPFNRFSDTLSADEVELNFKYVIQVSLCRRLSYAGRRSMYASSKIKRKRPTGSPYRSSG